MQFRVFAIPATGSPDLEAELNAFLRSHRIVSVQKTLENWESSPRWCFCVEYLDGAPPSGAARAGGGRAPRVDYREILSEPDFAVFAKLRDLRKELAGADAIPLFAVCTNEQLAEMAKRRPQTLPELKEIDGFGDAKAAKYGEALLAALPQKAKKDDETGGKPD
jgi:superfamily II DNA helicase RecQ